MHASRRISVLRPWLVALAVPLATGACDDGQVIDECVGALTITVPLAPPPAKLRIELRRADRPDVVTIHDDCSGEGGTLILERRAEQLLVNDGGFGYTPPGRFDLKITDLGTCDGSTTTVVDVSNVEVVDGVRLCDSAEVTLPAS